VRGKETKSINGEEQGDNVSELDKQGGRVCLTSTIINI
jgi:hypothetical protein